MIVGQPILAADRLSRRSIAELIRSLKVDELQPIEVLQTAPRIATGAEARMIVGQPILAADRLSRRSFDGIAIEALQLLHESQQELKRG